MSNAVRIGHYSVRGHNRRILIEVYHEAGGPVVAVETRTLQGDWRGRKITNTCFVYGYDTFVAMAEVFGMVRDSPFFQRSANPHARKTKRFSIGIWQPETFPKL